LNQSSEIRLRQNIFPDSFQKVCSLCADFIRQQIGVEKFERVAGIPVAGDDVMSQIGATVLHKSLVKMLVDRGVKIDKSYQLNSTKEEHDDQKGGITGNRIP
jgi:hypothetical protein